MNVSFAGCGFLGLYHVGVASCLKTYAPQLYINKVSGASAGSMAALALLADLPLGDMTSQVLKIATEARKCTLGPFSPSFNINQILLDGLQNILPENVHEKINGKLHVSLTKVYDGKNLLVNQFSSKQEVVDVILASAFIPIFSGWLPPRYRGIRVIDGGYSDNLPVLDTKTVTVSPFCGDSDICPQDDYILTVLQVQIAGTSIEMSKDNMIRLSRVLIPPDPEVLSRYCKQGFEDALRFLQRRYLISCTRCLAVDSTYQIESEDPADQGSSEKSGCSVYDPNCLECKLKRHIAQQSTVPDTVWRVFEEAIDDAENGFTSWLKTINSYRIVRLLTYPARLQLSVVQKLLTRLSGLQAVIGEDSLMRKTVESLSEQLCKYATSGGYLQPSHRAMYTCEMNITQYGEEESRRDSVKDILNLGLTAHLECEAAPQLPHDRMSAVKFQHENMSAAVTNGRQTSSPSSTHSRVVSRAVSAAPSLLGSRMGSRCNSMSSLYEVDGPLPDTIGQIQAVTEQQEAVISYYYTGEDNQVKLMEIYDVSETDPALLVGDQLGVNYDLDQVIRPAAFSCDNLLALHPARHRHSSEPAFAKSRARHHSGPVTLAVTPTNPVSPIFKVGDNDTDDDSDDETHCHNYSDPESDWVTETIQS